MVTLTLSLIIATVEDELGRPLVGVLVPDGELLGAAPACSPPGGSLTRAAHRARAPGQRRRRPSPCRTCPSRGPRNLGASWPAHAHRCRQQLPADLASPAPLLDPEHPQAGHCGHEQACRLIVWQHHLPTCQHVSFTCQRLTRPTVPAGR